MLRTMVVPDAAVMDGRHHDFGLKRVALSTFGMFAKVRCVCNTLVTYCGKKGVAYSAQKISVDRSKLP